MATSITNALSGSGDTSSSSTSSNNSTTSAFGLGAGIDINSFVQAALAGQQADITNLQNEQSTLGSQTSELSTITSDLNALQTAVNALSDPLGAMNALAANSSDSSVLTATTSNLATAGTHTIIVNSLATTSTAYSDEVPSSSAALTGSFSISVGGGTPVAIPINANDGTNALSGLENYINSQSNLGVTASIVQDANGARLALVSNTIGAAGNLTLTGSLNYTNASGGTQTANFNSGIQGTNASLTVDGIPVSSAINTVNNVISGVTLNLNAAAPGTTVSLNIAPDTTQATTAINTFVTAYNQAIQDINSQFAVASDGSGGGPLEADSTVRDAQAALLSAVAYAAGNGAINSLATMGISLNDDGTLSVDNATLSSALSGNTSAVQSFLQNATTGFAANLNNVLNGLVEPGSGSLALDSQGITQSSNDLGDQISDMQAALAVQQQQLTQTYSQVNTTLQELPLLEAQMSQQLSSI
jgi:flagellar hook-associated protein 2